MAKNEMTRIIIIVAIILAILILLGTQPGLRTITGDSTAVGLTGGVTEGGTIDCSVSVTDITFTGSRGTNVTASQTPVIKSLAQATTIDVSGQMTSFGSWFSYSSESPNWILKHALNGTGSNSKFLEQNVGYSGGTVGTNTLAKAGAANINITEPLIFRVYFPVDAYAKNYTGTYTITCSANAASLDGVNLTFKSRTVPYPAVTTLNPDTQYDALLTNTLSGGLAVTDITSLSIADGTGNIVPQTIIPGGCADPAYPTNICARFTYTNGTTLIRPGVIYGKAVGAAAANLATAVVTGVSG